MERGRGRSRIPINPDRIARLTTVGLNEQQARAYLSLLDVETAGVNEIATLSRVPRAKLYEVLEALNRKGLVDIIPDTPQRYRANPLSALYDTRVEELRAEEAELKRAIADLATQLMPAPRTAGADPERDFVHIGHGRTHFSILAREQVRDAHRSVLIVGDRLLPARLRLFEDLTEALVQCAARLTLRILVPENVVDAVEGRRVRLDELTGVVRRARMPLGDALLLVRDEAEYLVVRFVPNDLHASRGSDRVEVGHDGEIASLLHRLGAAAWEAGTPWTPSR